jgi:lysophospholipase L1-like esterase
MRRTLSRYPGFLILSAACLVAPRRPALAEEAAWVGAWFAGSTLSGYPLEQSTERTEVRLTAGGDQVRVRISNLFGKTPLAVGAAGVSARGASQALTFSGQPGTRVPPGDTVISDPAPFHTAAGEDLAVSLFFPGPIPAHLTLNYRNAEDSRLIPGNAVLATTRPATAVRVATAFFLAGVDVAGGEARGTIVVLGDSMMDGGSTRWPALLAQRLAAAGRPYAVTNAAIGGNCLIRDQDNYSYGGLSALHRFDRDVLQEPNVTYLIVYEGINDICLEGIGHPSSPATADEVIAAMKELAGRAHSHGLKVYLATLVQVIDRDSGYSSPAKNEVRKAVNRWILGTHDIDGVIDFDRAMADPNDPERMDSRYHNGDYHPNDRGQQRLSEAVDLAFFR